MNTGISYLYREAADPEQHEDIIVEGEFFPLYARDQLVNGLSRLRETAADLAQQDVTGIVESFGQMGRRRFQLAA